MLLEIKLSLKVIIDNRVIRVLFIFIPFKQFFGIGTVVDFRGISNSDSQSRRLQLKS